MRGYISVYEDISARAVAPSISPIDLQEAKDHLQITDNDDDVLILALINAATEYFDGGNGVLGRALITQTWTLSVQRPENNAISIPMLPVQYISSISYYDTDNASQALTVSDFFLYKTDDWAYLEPKPGVNWPTTYNRKDAMTVTYVAGYGDTAESVPALIRQAILLTLRHLYDNRSATSDLTIKEVPMSVESIVNMLKRGWVS